MGRMREMGEGCFEFEVCVGVNPGLMWEEGDVSPWQRNRTKLGLCKPYFDAILIWFDLI